MCVCKMLLCSLTVLNQMDGPEDSDVVAERERIQAGGAADELIRLQGLRKVYHNGKVAVNNLWYSIKQNECFGFLGVNGMLNALFI
jgi:hypothetical protein